MSKHQGKPLTVMPKKPVRRDYGRAPWDVDTPAVVPKGLKTIVCHSPPHFGRRARLDHVSEAQMANRLPPLKAGSDA